MPLDVSVLTRFRNGYRVFVETGTYHGDGVKAALAAGFQEVHSIELADLHFQNAKRVFANEPRVHLWFGDSSRVIGSVIKSISDPILFWLDGHHSCGDTAKGEKWSPLMDELKVIAEHPVKTHTILVDDMRCWNRDNPEFRFGKEDIEAAIRAINPNYVISYVTGDPRFVDDVLVAVINPGIKSTTKDKPLLLSCAKNVYSQFGEDGIISKLFDCIGRKEKQLCIEFGATDGFWYSNTAHLWSTNRDWKAVLIESNPQHIPALTRNTDPHKNCLPIHRKVKFEKDDPNTLNNILRDHAIVIPNDGLIDLLSIDVDGDDCYIFQSLKRDGLKARIVIVEHNPTFPYWMDIAQTAGRHAGCSVAALTRIAKDDGYRLVCVTDSNCIFLHETSDYEAVAKMYETDVEKMCAAVLRKYLSCVISTYNGLQKTLNHGPYGSNGVMPNDTVILSS